MFIDNKYFNKSRYTMRRTNNNNKQAGKKIWKGGSPPYQLKSPRFARNGKNSKHEDSRKQKEENLPNLDKNKEAISSFKNQLRILKEEANRMLSTDPERRRSRAGSRFKAGHGQSKIEALPEGPLEQYCIRNSTANNFQLGPKAPIIRHNSFQELPAPPHSPHQKSLQKLYEVPNTKRFHETIRKFTLENLKIKRENEELRNKILELGTQKQNCLLQIKQLKSNKKSQISQNSIFLTESLRQEVKALRKQVQRKGLELKQCSLEGYQLKKQLFEVETERNRYQQEAMKLKSRDRGLKQKRGCAECQKYQKCIYQLSKEAENKGYDLGKKESIINGLCKEIKNLEDRARACQRPKNTLQRYQNVVKDTNEEIMKIRIQMLNQKMEGKRKREKERGKSKTTPINTKRQL